MCSHRRADYAKESLHQGGIGQAIPNPQSDALWKTPTVKLDAILSQYASLLKGVHRHTDSRIFPAAAIHLTVKPAIGPEKACAVIENAVVQNCAGIASKLKEPLINSAVHLAVPFTTDAIADFSIYLQ